MILKPLSIAGGENIFNHGLNRSLNPDSNPDLRSVLSVVKFYRKQRAAFRGVCGCEGAAVLGDDAVCQGEADAVAFCFRGEKGDEDLLKICWWNPRASIAHLNHDCVVMTCRA